ncbi:MAG: TonB-dependent receptor plug domain-containing protein, partial [Opitutaceae bacterium]
MSRSTRSNLLRPSTSSTSREGNAAAITQQRNADNVKSVMASDAFGNVADLNIGNFLMRMPGVTKTEAEGDVVGIMIRGISDSLSMVTIDGEQGASASPLGGLRRGFEVDKISADFIESIEVVKSLTPDMDAGAIGGIVNMKTKSALTRKGRHLNFQAGESYNVWRKTFRPFGVFANFTWLQTKGNYTDPNGVSSAGAVPGFTPRSGNVGLSWIAHGWTIRIKAKYEGDRLRVYNANPAQRIYVNDNFPIDLNVAYTINRNLGLFVDVINVFDSRTFDDYQIRGGPAASDLQVFDLYQSWNQRTVLT